MAEIKSTNKYLVKRKYKTINGTTYPMDEYQVILYKVDSEDCGYIRPQYQWSATTGYICDFETFTKYSREVKMVSYDSGETWSVKQPVEEQKGSPIAYDSYDCGKPMYRCVETNETYCEDNGDDYAISYFFSGNDTDVPDLTIPCTNGIINNQDEDLFAYGSSRKPDPSTVTRTVIGDCVTELDDLFWQYSASTLTVGNSVRKINVRTIGVPSHDANQRAFISSLSNPIVLPRSVRTIKEESTNYSSGVTINIKPLANPSDFLIEGYSTSLPKCTYKLVATYGTSFSWKEAMSLENVSGCTVYQEDYQTPNEDWKVKITFEDNSVNYLADDPTHVLGANEIARMSNVLADSNSDRHWYTQNTEVFVGTYGNGQRIKEIEIASSVSAITENAIKNYYSYICNYKLNEGLLVFGDTFNNRVSPYMGNEYHNYTITMPSTLTAITSYSICSSPQTYNNVKYGYRLKFTSVIPPTIQYNGALNNVVYIMVPCGSMNRYSTEWSQYANKIVPIEDECYDEIYYEDKGTVVCVGGYLWKEGYKCRRYNDIVVKDTEAVPYENTSIECYSYQWNATSAVLVDNQYHILETKFKKYNGDGGHWDATDETRIGDVLSNVTYSENNYFVESKDRKGNGGSKHLMYEYLNTIKNYRYEIGLQNYRYNSNYDYIHSDKLLTVKFYKSGQSSSSSNYVIYFSDNTSSKDKATFYFNPKVGGGDDNYAGPRTVVYQNNVCNFEATPDYLRCFSGNTNIETKTNNAYYPSSSLRYEFLIPMSAPWSYFRVYSETNELLYSLIPYHYLNNGTEYWGMYDLVSKSFLEDAW